MRKALAGLWLTLGFSFANAALAEGFFDQLRDTDGWMDASDWVLENAVGFMPVPIIITEPAVGEGLGLAALFFHPPKDYEKADYDEAGLGDEDFVLPDISAVAAAYTANGTWFVGGGHFAFWKDDTIRYEGFGGYANINLRFYGLLDDIFPDGSGIKFTGEGVGRAVVAKQNNGHANASRPVQLLVRPRLYQIFHQGLFSNIFLASSL